MKHFKISSKHIIHYLFVIVFFTGCNSSNKKENLDYYLENGEIFHTYFNIKYEYNRSVKEEIMEALQKFDQSLNPFKENSIIGKVNNNVPVTLDSLFINVFEKSMEVSQKTNGKFDITSSPFINAWGFGFKDMDNVTPEKIDSMKSFVGYNKIRIENGIIVKDDPRIQINTSAISKGYSCDIVAHLLQDMGIENYMVEIGGEITMRGTNEKGNCWRIGIDKPTDDSSAMSRELQIILSICDKAVATSGNYRNYYIKEGVKYSHTIDPQTGYPSEKDILGATVIADDCMTADAYATAFMAMGVEKSVEVAKTIPGLHYYFIYVKPDGEVAYMFSDEFQQFLVDKVDISQAS
ncbi:MAG: FAD:protein FMN transferase [Dysgonamonadaceae bacterium]|nr:FAD:protein FMN transferase [Dysgonamonadaceae bacterium]MDD4729805.1 FAD:protein FMN transferase [Dysgonamonadaceae bacterium]